MSRAGPGVPSSASRRGPRRPVSCSTSDRIDVDIQYSANGTTGWNTEKTVRTGFDEQFIVENLPGRTDG
ncbi:hypothetical protein [Streptomyces sp. NPDC003522]